MIRNTLTHTIGLAAGFSQLTKLGQPPEQLSIVRIDDDSLLLLKQTQIMCHGNRSRGAAMGVLCQRVKCLQRK